MSSLGPAAPLVVQPCNWSEADNYRLGAGSTPSERQRCLGEGGGLRQIFYERHTDGVSTVAREIGHVVVRYR